MTRALVALGIGGSAEGPDLSVDLETFSLIQYIPKHALKIAESGLKPSKIPEIAAMGFNAVLVGTSLLKAPNGIANMLADFERAIADCPDAPPASASPK